MRVSQLIFALSAALVTYLGVQLTVSTAADSAFSSLAAYRGRLEANVSELQAHHRRLTATAELYRTDRRAVALEARELSYYDDGERVIRIPARSVSPAPLSPGSIMRNRQTTPNQRGAGALSAIIVFLLVMFVQVVLDEHGATPQSTRRASR